MARRVRPRLTTYYNCTATRYSSTLSIAQRIGLRIRIEQVRPLEEAAKVHEQARAGHTRGKIVLEVG
ncbi:MAG: zinc-binding dehydrogenase [Actinomycetota bacterium]|nr:zinc-binding dehydrogenase [Actinomycetota bacterium]